VPAGKSLSVDRIKFSELITEKLMKNQYIKIINEEITEIDADSLTVIAAGPLITERLFENLRKLTGTNSLFFFDAIAPIVFSESIDFSNPAVVIGNRYDETGDGDYVNLLMTKIDYDKFYESLISAELNDPHDFEKNHFFQGCMPVEEIASKGYDTLRFGTMKPVGFRFKDGTRPFAVVQLRKEDAAGKIYNMVGFQTRLKYGEQDRVFKLLPGMNNAEFARKGSMHRNSYLNAPAVLNKNLNLKNHPNLFIAGQLTGVEGYVESIGSGLIAGINAADTILKKEFIKLPAESMIGSLINYICDEKNINNFQPMNANFGILPPLEKNIKNKKERYFKYSDRALEEISRIRLASPAFHNAD